MEQVGPGEVRSGRGRGEAVDCLPVEAVGLIRPGQERPGSGEQAEGVLGAAGLGPAPQRLDGAFPAISGSPERTAASTRSGSTREWTPIESPATRACAASRAAA